MRAKNEMTLDLAAWIESARSDPVEFRRRQVLDIAFAAIARSVDLRDNLLLKGGTLMAIAYGSPRETADIDFTTTFAHPRDVDRLVQLLSSELANAITNLGYADLACRIQGTKMKPPQASARFPTLEVRIGSAKTSDPRDLARLQSGHSIHVTKLEISFNEYVADSQRLTIDADGAFVLAYSLHDLIAEKFRALLQQPSRNRRRRQDVYDIARLVRYRTFTDADKSRILDALKTKSASRGIAASPDGLGDEDVVERARSEYSTMALEIPGESLDFERDFADVEAFYRSLPWD